MLSQTYSILHVDRVGLIPQPLQELHDHTLLVKQTGNMERSVPIDL